MPRANPVIPPKPKLRNTIHDTLYPAEVSEVEFIQNELIWMEEVEQERVNATTPKVGAVDMEVAESFMEDSSSLYHSDWSDWRKHDIRMVETAALTGRNPSGDIRPMVRDQDRGRIC